MGIDLKELRGGRLFAAGAAQGGIQIGNFNFFHFGIEVHALFRDEDSFLAAGAVMEQVLGQVFRSDDVAGTMTTRRWTTFSSSRTLPGQV